MEEITIYTYIFMHTYNAYTHEYINIPVCVCVCVFTYIVINKVLLMMNVRSGKYTWMEVKHTHNVPPTHGIFLYTRQWLLLASSHPCRSFSRTTLIYFSGHNLYFPSNAKLIILWWKMLRVKLQSLCCGYCCYCCLTDYLKPNGVK